MIHASFDSIKVIKHEEVTHPHHPICSLNSHSATFPKINQLKIALHVQ